MRSVLVQGWEPVGFWTLFWVGLEEGVIMWAGALPCILLVVLLNKNYIVSVVITFFYTIVNYIFSMNDLFLTQPFGLNIGTLLPGPAGFPLDISSFMTRAGQARSWQSCWSGSARIFSAAPRCSV